MSVRGMVCVPGPFVLVLFGSDLFHWHCPIPRAIGVV